MGEAHHVSLWRYRKTATNFLKKDTNESLVIWIMGENEWLLLLKTIISTACGASMLLQLDVYYLCSLKAVAGGTCEDCVWPLTLEPAQALNNLGVKKWSGPSWQWLLYLEIAHLRQLLGPGKYVSTWWAGRNYFFNAILASLIWQNNFRQSSQGSQL